MSAELEKVIGKLTELFHEMVTSQQQLLQNNKTSQRDDNESETYINGNYSDVINSFKYLPELSLADNKCVNEWILTYESFKNNMVKYSHVLLKQK